MKILILATMAPLLGFYVYALVNFKRELRRAKREEVRDAQTILLHRSDGQLSGEDRAAETAAKSLDFKVLPGGKRQAVSRVAHEPEREIYQLESAYLGPFLLIPVQKRSEKASQQNVTQITARRAG
jgi:hypothetical protein